MVYFADRIWVTAHSALSIPDAGSKNIRTDLAVAVFKTLRPATDDFLTTFVRALCSLYEFSPRDQTPSLRRWWNRLFSLAIASDVELVVAPDDFYLSAINSSGRRLAIALLQDSEKYREDGVAIAPRLVKAVDGCAKAPGLQGSFARAVLIRHSSFIVSLDLPQVTKRLGSALSSESQEGKALRKILVCNTEVSERVSNAFSKQVLRGVTECDATGGEAHYAAAKILAPGLSALRKQSTADAWGISFGDAAFALRNSGPQIHAAAAAVLVEWSSKLGGPSQVIWRKLIRPLLEQVWPREKCLEQSKRLVI